MTLSSVVPVYSVLYRYRERHRWSIVDVSVLNQYTRRVLVIIE